MNIKGRVYEFRCKFCGHVREFIVRGTEREELHCKDCGSTDLEKLLSVPNISSSGHMLARKGNTCCGREERCDAPPCFSGRCER